MLGLRLPETGLCRLKTYVSLLQDKLKASMGPLGADRVRSVCKVQFPQQQFVFAGELQDEQTPARRYLEDSGVNTLGLGAALLFKAQLLTSTAFNRTSVLWWNVLPSNDTSKYLILTRKSQAAVCPV